MAAKTYKRQKGDGPFNEPITLNEAPKQDERPKSIAKEVYGDDSRGSAPIWRRDQ